MQWNIKIIFAGTESAMAYSHIQSVFLGQIENEEAIELSSLLLSMLRR